MCLRQRVLFCSLAAAVVFVTSADAGTVRYELPELLGEHRWDGTTNLPQGRWAHVDTPFGFYSVAEARLVVEGTVSAAKAHGDGLIREALEFELEPSVSAIPDFARSFRLSDGTPVGMFRIDEVYPHPFVPETIPLPNPDGYPPISFYVRFGVGPSFGTNYPPVIVPIEPGQLFFATDGIVVDVPIIANVTEAYIVLEGPGVVPEPAVWSLILGAAIVYILSRGLRPCRM